MTLDVNAVILNLMPILNALRLKLNAKSGFTLIELLVVIAIIAILITVIVATFGTTQAKARDSRRKSDLDAFKKALELYKGDTPGSAWYPACDASSPCDLTDAAAFDPAMNVLYLRDFPTDPEGVNEYSYDTDIADACIGDIGNGDPGCNGYEIVACLENENDSSREEDDGGAADRCGGAVADGYVGYVIHNP